MTSIVQKQMFPVFDAEYDGQKMREFVNQLERFLKQSDFTFQNRTVVSAASYVMLRTDEFLGITRTATGTCGITLPLAASDTFSTGTRIRMIGYKDEGLTAGTNNITFTRSGSDTVEGGTSLVVAANGASGWLYSDGISKWFHMAGMGTSAAQTYTPTNAITDRAYDANATTVDELADVLGTLYGDLKARGVI